MLTISDLDEAIEFTDVLIAARKAAEARLMMTRDWDAKLSPIQGADKKFADLQNHRTAKTVLRKARRLLISYRSRFLAT